MSGESGGPGSSEKSDIVADRRRPLVGVVIVLLLFVVPGLLFFVIPLGITTYDDGHRMTVTCAVRSASTGAESSGSFRGGGASGTQVVVVTEQCGKVLLQDGVSSSNAADVAEEIARADRVRFTVGAASYGLREALGIFGVSPTASAYEVE